MYCVSLNSIYARVYPELEKLLCMDTAASKLGLTNGWGIPMKFYHTKGDVLNSSYIQGYKVIAMDNVDLVELSDGIKCTTPERTIRDLLTSSTNEALIVECLANYLPDDESDELDLTVLDALAVNNNMQQLIEKYKPRVLQYLGG